LASVFYALFDTVQGSKNKLNASNESIVVSNYVFFHQQLIQVNGQLNASIQGDGRAMVFLPNRRQPWRSALST
jgi:hypothetical protein